MRQVMGIFNTTENADSAYTNLLEKGYRDSQISVISKDTTVEKTEGSGPVQHAVGGGAAGATTGGMVGGLAGALMAAGVLTIPGIGPLLIGGPLVAALGITGGAATIATTAITGAAAGGLIGALTGLGLPENTAKIYTERISGGATVLSVTVNDNEESAATESLKDQGASDVVTVTEK